MRPINKGRSPYASISNYSEALPFLESAIGCYCSYCGFPIFHVPEVEHVAAKANGGSKTDWNNLLLGCKYCNARKGKRVGSTNVDEYLWPDVYNTAIAFSYKGGVPVINEDAIKQIDKTGEVLNRARKLFELLEFDPLSSKSNRDRRVRKRNEVYDVAQRNLKAWYELGHGESLKNVIVDSAKGYGFFSVWMEVFREEKEILEALIEAFPGTRRECFDESGKPKCELMELRY